MRLLPTDEFTFFALIKLLNRIIELETDELENLGVDNEETLQDFVRLLLNLESNLRFIYIPIEI